MKAQRLRRKLADKSARIRLKLEQHNEDAAMAAFRLQDLQQELHQIESRNNKRQEAGCIEDESYEQVVAGNPIENVSHQFFGELSEAFGEASQAHHIRDSFPGPNFSPSLSSSISSALASKGVHSELIKANLTRTASYQAKLHATHWYYISWNKQIASKFTELRLIGLMKFSRFRGSVTKQPIFYICRFS